MVAFKIAAEFACSCFIKREVKERLTRFRFINQLNAK